MVKAADNSETLLDRSKRILGISLDVPDDDEQADHTNSKTSPSDRRRAQVSQAQRTHRFRTQRYIRELENEVLRLRSREKLAQGRIRSLEAQLAPVADSPPVQDILSSYPSGSVLSNSDLASQRSFVSSHDGFQSPVNIDLTAMMRVAPEQACSNSAAARLPTDFDGLSETSSDIVSQYASEVSTPQSQSVSSVDTQYPVIALDAQAAVDFILFLERPCLSHVKYALENNLENIPPQMSNHSGPAHVFTATYSFLKAPSAPGSPSHPFSIPQFEVDSLLDASGRLALEYEITPVQVWQKVKELANGMTMTAPLLEALTRVCGKYTYCNAFGAVIDKAVVEVILSTYFPPKLTGY